MHGLEALPRREGGLGEQISARPVRVLAPDAGAVGCQGVPGRRRRSPGARAGSPARRRLIGATLGQELGLRTR